MARIVYGVSGEGSGHAARAREMLGYLLGSGHDVRAVSYDRGYRDLHQDFRVFETEGLTIETVDNVVSVSQTILENLGRVVEGHRKARELKARLFEEFRPHVVITDFEPMTAYLAHHFELPLISLDNQHRMRYMEFPCPPRLRSSRLATQAVIRAMVPRPDVSLVTTFYFGEVTNDRTFLFPPILRREVREARPGEGEHVLVYLTHGFESFLEVLGSLNRERFFVYGAERAGHPGNMTFKAPSREGFLEDLASAKAVMATAGFTLMTESLHLGKPYLALPMRGQFEQELNALLLEKLGYGRSCSELDGEAVADFLEHLPQYRETLETYPRGDNREIQAKLDALLADAAALAGRYRRYRKGGGRP